MPLPDPFRSANPSVQPEAVFAAPRKKSTPPLLFATSMRFGSGPGRGPSSMRHRAPLFRRLSPIFFGRKIPGTPPPFSALGAPCLVLFYPFLPLPDRRLGCASFSKNKKREAALGFPPFLPVLIRILLAGHR